jgi:hypothetical protein
MATCSASELLAAGTCFQCLTKKELQVVIAQLLCEIVEGGGGGGGTPQVFANYPAPPTDPTKAALSYPSGGGTLYQWDLVTLAWV